MTITWNAFEDKLIVEPSYTVFEDTDRLHSKGYITLVENELFNYSVAVHLDEEFEAINNK